MACVKMKNSNEKQKEPDFCKVPFFYGYPFFERHTMMGEGYT